MNDKECKELCDSQSNDRIQKLISQRDNRIMIIVSVVIGIIILISIYLMNGSVNAGATSVFTSYQTALESERDATYNEIKEKYFEIAEANYHVSNQVSISIENLKETANLEVLTVSDVEYIVENAGDNGSGITSWLEVPGTATYIVNLQAAEFIIDNDRDYVLVRAPYPEITNISIDYSNVNKLLFVNSGFNESYKVGEDLARRQLNSADLLIKKEFTSNQHFYLNAEEAAKNTIECLIRQFNPDIEDLVVEIEFF